MPMQGNNNLLFDAHHIWHPYSSANDQLPIHEVISADGVWLKLADGRQIIDGMASWWSVIHGYNHPRLNQAAKQQIDRMAHVMFGGITHQPAITLARQLIDMTAAPLQKVFFADSGSIAVEVAIKMAMQYWLYQGKPNKRRLLAHCGGYHGDTFGTMAVCDPDNGMHTLFSSVLTRHLFAPLPACQYDKDWQESDIAECRQIIEKHHHQLAAVIIEPIVQGAGGMRFYCPMYLRKLRLLCDQYDVLLIFDEIATGFGRTGSLFAYEEADVCPDILCLGKALTGGYMTLAATLCSDKIADGAGVLMHGPTFMANPLACAIAAESITVLLESDWQKRICAIEKQLSAELMPYQSSRLVKDVRIKGAIGVVELYTYLDDEMTWLPLFIVEQGVWIRPFRNLIYIMPPYIIEPADLTKLTVAIGAIIKRLDN